MVAPERGACAGRFERDGSRFSELAVNDHRATVPRLESTDIDAAAYGRCQAEADVAADRHVVPRRHIREVLDPDLVHQAHPRHELTVRGGR